MIEVLAQFGVGFVTALSGVLMPGPMFAFIILKSTSYGSKAGPLITVGHALVEFGIILLLIFGLGFVLKSEIFQTAIAMMGGMSLLALGTIYLIGIRKIHEFRPNIGGLKHNPVIGGILFSTIFNPSVALWWATIGLTSLMNALIVAALAGAMFWTIGHFIADMSWYSLVSYSSAKGRRVLSPKAYRGLLAACGCFLICFGLYLIARYGLYIV